ncbi:MAG: ABC transporter permease [Duncaniella sp.]|uniref:ABC transporter permease n=1 Tax=Duncaniella sp. TaxID=2518496 RepID=UPI0023C0217E|nr:ABC transporter permease [Duncaniella sp.]MDE5989701.1 ABC transporter permease [Duncaniella sp.]
MQIRSSLSQLWRESRANPGFTALYIGGVAFAVAFTMVYAIIYYVNLAPLYPEYNRDTTSYSAYIQIRNDSTSSTHGSLVSKKFIDEFIASSENIEYCSIIVPNRSEGATISTKDGSIKVVSKLTDRNFFRLYDYEFLAGQPFSEMEVESEKPFFVVITNTIADRVFGNAENAVGKEILIDYRPHKVVGVIRRGNPVANTSYADIIRPYTITPISVFEYNGSLKDYLGSFAAYIKFSDSRQRERFMAEYSDKVSRAKDSDGFKINSAKVKTHYEGLLEGNEAEPIPLENAVRTLIIMLLVLLLVPAINISGMIGGQMDRRMAETGLRRSFGATRGNLIRQVMFENFILTLIGGLIGFVIAWIIVFFGRRWLLQLLVSSWEMIDAPIDISAEMLFAPAIFVGALLFCLILNLLSAYIPASLSLRRPIVNSLNSKQ